MSGKLTPRRLDRSWILVGAVLAPFLIPAELRAQDTDQNDELEGERLYIAKGCLGCHGASGRGGVGPALAATVLPMDAFLHQLRDPRDIMPVFPEEIVSEEEAEEIHEYLQELPRDMPRLRADLPQGTLDPATCAECHQGLQPAVVRQFEASAMGQPGTQNPRVEQRPTMTCADCHGTDHDKIMATQGRVPETTCAGCHAQIYQEHVLDAGHSYGPGPGDLGINWERNIGVPNYAQMPRKVMEMGCDPATRRPAPPMRNTGARSRTSTSTRAASRTGTDASPATRGTRSAWSRRESPRPATRATWVPTTPTTSPT